MATTTVAAATSSFIGTRLTEAHSGSGRVQARFGFGTKKAPPKKVKKSVSSDRPLWYPGAQAPEWLDGSLVGDYGFDPFGLGKPAEYLQYDLDSLDQNLSKNLAGDVIGTRTETADVKSTPFQPYSEVFGLQRFRECELIHGRWAMLATLGALTVEWLTGITWQDAGKVELVEGSSYLGQPLPFSITTLIWIEVLVIGYIEFQRNAELDPEKRLYPGGKFFDPLGLAADPEKKATLQLAEIKHARLAMVAFLGFAVQAAATGKGPLNNWATHLSKSFQVRVWNPVPGFDGRLKYLELYLITVGGFIDLCIEFLYSTHLHIFVHGVLNPSHMNNFEHSGMLLMFFIFGVITLLSEKTSFLPLPEGALCLIASAAFTAEYLLFYFHSTTHKGLEGYYHLILVLLIGLCILSIIAGALVPTSFPVDLCNGIAITLQGLWFYQTAFTLYGPMMPDGCSLKGNEITCHSAEQQIHGELLANVQLFGLVLGVLVAVTGAYIYAEPKYGRLNLNNSQIPEDG